MPPSTFAGGRLRVIVPPSYEVERASPERRRRSPGGERATAKVSANGRAAVIASLEDSGLVEVERVDLTPRRSREPAGRAAPARSAKVRLEVDVASGQDAVVLLEHEGVYSWRLPVRPTGTTRTLRRGPRTVRFEVEVTPRPARGGRPRSVRTKGLLGGVVHGAVQAIVFRFAAPALLGRAVDKMEAHVRPGLVHLAGAKTSTWRHVETLDQLHLPTDRPVRVLLLVHGTFSSTLGAFGALGIEPAGKTFLGDAVAAYDAVIGFDHKTLSVDPLENARNLLKRLRTHRPAGDLVIDVIAHSRGGLVARAFAEEVLPSAGWGARTDVAVFVAATNAGTHMADPQRWGDLVDLYTNFASVTARELSQLPAGAPVAAVVGGLVRGIGAFVKYLVAYAADGGDVPGLAAMVPDGPFLTRLNKTQAGQPGPGASWYVVSSNFHVSLLDDRHAPQEFPRELAARLAEGFVDRLFKADNDLVVDTGSMSAIDTAIGGPASALVKGSLELGENDVVYHNNYFTQASVLEAIASWLSLRPDPEGADEVAALRDQLLEESAEPEATREVSDRAPHRARLGFSGAVSGDPTAAAPSELVTPPSPATSPADLAGLDLAGSDLAGSDVAGSDLAGSDVAGSDLVGSPSDSSSSSVLTRATVAAEMPEQVVVGVDFAVRVRLSRREIQTSAGSVHTESNVLVDPDRPLTVQVIGKSNVQILSPVTDVFQLPPGGGVSELEFHAESIAVGPLVVMVVVRQGRIPIATLSLAAAAVSKHAETVHQGGSVTAAVHPGIDAPELDGLPCMDIIERHLPDGSVIFQYALRLVPGRPAAIFESRPIKDRVRRMGKILDDVASIWKNTGPDPRERERKLQDIGAKMFDELFPEPMQAHLWRHRSRVKNLIVYADEPFVPWELVHLKPPGGPRPVQPRFLAQSGLVRWQLGSFPPRELRVRKGRARSLCPEYRDPRFALTEPVRERLFLEREFGAKSVTATSAGVRQLLRSGQFDLLHFSGHGAADPDDILDAKLLLRGRRRGGTVVAEYLGATTVSANAARFSKHQPGPLVVLNACQTGRAGMLLSTVGGFANAFLDAGASAFVSCLWSVREQPSRVFVEKLYDELLSGTPMGVASARARAVTRKAGDATWLSFVVYARPDAVLVRT